jgi:hypothetical protein
MSGAAAPDDWLSGVLGVETFRVDVSAPPEALAAHLAAHRPAFYYAKVDTADIDTTRRLADLAFYVVEANITFGVPPAALRVPAAPASVERGDAGDCRLVLPLQPLSPRSGDRPRARQRREAGMGPELHRGEARRPGVRGG